MERVQEASAYGAVLQDPAARIQRIQVHTRSVEYCGYQREDGRWDIETEFKDVKPYTHLTPDKRIRQAGEPVHGMVICPTVDDDMKIHDVFVGMPATPFLECQQARNSKIRPIIAFFGSYSEEI